MKRGLSVLIAAAWAMSASALTLEDASLRIVLGEAEDGFGVKGVVNRLAGDVSFGALAGGRDLWEVRFMKKGATTNEFCTVSNRSSARTRRHERGTDGLRLIWQGVDLPNESGVLDVTAEVRLTAPGTSEWRISLKNRSRVWTQHTVDYPIVRKVMPEKSGAALLPWKNLGGRLLKSYDSARPDQRGEFNVPGTFMPLCAFLLGEAGLYFAAHDGEMRLKRLKIARGPDVCFSTVLEDAGVSGKAAEGPRYAVTLAAFRGDWWEAAHRYRDWALGQKWCRKGKIAFRKDFPKIAAETDIWVNTGGGYDSLTNRMTAFRKCWPDLTVGVGWACWYATQPGNRMNPEFFPLRDPRIPEVVRHPLARDVHFMPYVNGRIWDLSAAGFAYARAEATVDEDGRLYEESYPPATFAVMCPACPTWQEVQRDLGRRCLDTFGCDMLYYDQVSCSRAKPCFDPAHGHPLGGGTWWTDGYRTMFEAIHSDFEKRGAAVTSEQLGEAWLDVIDAYLNASSMLADDVPLFPAVYQGYCVHFGRAVGCDKPHQTRVWRFLQDAKTVLWGEAPGWIGPHIYLLRHYADEAENLLQVARFRRAYADFLVYGSLENEIRFEKDDPNVYGTVWRDAYGARTAAAFVNASDRAQDVRYRLPDETEWRKTTLAAFQLKLEEQKEK